MTTFVDGIFSDLRISAKITLVRKVIKSWLIANGYLSVDESGETKQTRLTEKSEAFGIVTVEKLARDGNTYKNIMYTPKAQRAVIAAFDEIAALAGE